MCYSVEIDAAASFWIWTKTDFYAHIRTSKTLFSHGFFIWNLLGVELFPFYTFFFLFLKGILVSSVTFAQFNNFVFASCKSLFVWLRRFSNRRLLCLFPVRLQSIALNCSRLSVDRKKRCRWQSVTRDLTNAHEKIHEYEKEGAPYLHPSTFTFSHSNTYDYYCNSQNLIYFSFYLIQFLSMSYSSRMCSFKYDKPLRNLAPLLSISIYRVYIIKEKT